MRSPFSCGEEATGISDVVRTFSSGMPEEPA